MKNFFKKCGVVSHIAVGIVGMAFGNFTTSACGECGIAACTENGNCKFAINNGLLGINRDVILRILGIVQNDNIKKAIVGANPTEIAKGNEIIFRNIVGMCLETYGWKNHSYFQKIAKESHFKISHDVERLSKKDFLNQAFLDDILEFYKPHTDIISKKNVIFVTSNVIDRFFNSILRNMVNCGSGLIDSAKRTSNINFYKNWHETRDYFALLDGVLVSYCIRNIFGLQLKSESIFMKKFALDNPLKNVTPQNNVQRTIQFYLALLEENYIINAENPEKFIKRGIVIRHLFTKFFIIEVEQANLSKSPTYMSKKDKEFMYSYAERIDRTLKFIENSN
ncbi:hypothetical protein FACS189465_2120 [Clostridia bacterium]|nr:hypothetical protein FACS189465_2120 [Clostridia bacterium]